jgi:DNA-binding transcriptional LysR family regulator
MSVMLQHLRYFQMFQTVMRTGNLTEAARLHGVSQPAVSHAVKELEQQVGFQLFSRSGGRVQPTPEALRLLPEVERLFAHVGDFAVRVSEIQDARAGHIEIATVPSFACRVLPLAIAEFRRRRPRVRVTLNVTSVQEVMATVKSERAEIGFAFSPLEEADLVGESLLETCMAVAAPASHPLSGRAKVSPADLAGDVVILPLPHTVPGRLLRTMLQERSIAFLDMLEVNSAAAAISMVRAGIGVAVVDPLTILAERDETLRLLPFEPVVRISMTAISSHHRPLSAAALDLLDCTRTAVMAEAVDLASLGIDSRLPDAARAAEVAPLR